MRTFLKVGIRVQTKKKIGSLTSLEKVDRFARSTSQYCSGRATITKLFELISISDLFVGSVFNAESENNIFEKFQEKKHSGFCMFCQKKPFWKKLKFFQFFVIFD